MSKGDETRQFIIERAAPIFNTKGIAATAMSDIMEATKLSKGSTYVHFEDKNELVLEVVDHNMQLLGSKISSAIGKANTAKEKLFAYIDVLRTPTHPPVAGGCPMLNFGMEADDRNEPVKQKVHQAVKVSQKIIADIIRNGIESGEFKPTWDYDEFATIMFAMIEGGQLICRVAGNNSKMSVISNVLHRMIDEQGI